MEKRNQSDQRQSLLLQTGTARSGEPLLACNQFDSERAAQGVHFKRSGFPGHRGIGGRGAPCCSTGRDPAAVFTVNEQLSDLLGHGNVVHHDRQLGCVHGALVCEEREQEGKG